MVDAASVAVVDDHELVAMAVQNLLAATPEVSFVGHARTVDELVRHPRRAELVLLDLSLRDGSHPADNVAALRRWGAQVLVLTSGEIDLSVAAIMALASTAMGAAAQAGVGTPGLVLIGIGTGLACGAVNGGLVAGMKLPSIVVTIGTMSLFRGISYIVLGDRAYGGYPESFAYFGQGYVVWVFSFEFVLFVLFAVIFGVLLHCTSFGRRIYAIGNNEFAARFSGIPVEKMKFTLFLLTGLMSGIAAICLTSRLGSTRPSIAQGWELEVITMVVLGGVSILGGSGTIPGVVIAAFVMGLVTFGLGLLNVPGIVMSIFIGLLLIVTISLPILIRRFRGRRAA